MCTEQRPEVGTGSASGTVGPGSCLRWFPGGLAAHSPRGTVSRILCEGPLFRFPWGLLTAPTYSVSGCVTVCGVARDKQTGSWHLLCVRDGRATA